MTLAVEGISYREDLEAWWPLYDHAPVKCMQFVRRGLPAIDVVAGLCKRRRECVQAGGHAGFWPKSLAKYFQHVHTFEPEAALFQCMRLNCKQANVAMYQIGLGAAAGTARFRSHISAGSWRVDDAGDREISMTTIDSLNLTRCDAILLDIEGHEVHALEGARQTVDRSSPIILCELLPRSRDAIEAWLLAAGYRRASTFGRDGVYAR
jgi:FkbM family methyltransferase